MMSGIKCLGTSEVVSAPGGRPSTRGTATGTKEIRCGKRLKCSTSDCVLVGMKKEILWPFWASLLEM